MPNTTGSFAGPIGGADIIKAAMASQGAGGSPLAQMSPSSPGFNPALATQPPMVGMPAGAGAPPMPMGGPPAPTGGAPRPVPPPAPQAQQPQGQPLFADPMERIIVDALIKQLERVDKTKKMMMGGGGY